VYALHVDYLAEGYRADRLGNVQFRGGSQNFNPSFAKAARVAIVEVDEIVEPGEIVPELIDLTGIFVSRVVKTTHAVDAKAWRRPVRRSPDQPRVYNSKPALTREGIARNAAKLVRDGTYVNLGVGIPTMVSNYLQGRDVILHAENGVLGYGRMVSEESEIDPDIYNAAGQFVALHPGASFFDSVTSFEMARGGRIDTVIRIAAASQLIRIRVDPASGRPLTATGSASDVPELARTSKLRAVILADPSRAPFADRRPEVNGVTLRGSRFVAVDCSRVSAGRS
jgi:3-oxoacid CoA-transferase